MIANFTTPDLVICGPNFGWNPGAFLYTLSGTVGATYTAVERGIPSIAFSTEYGVQTPYYYVNAITNADLKDLASILGELAANLVQQLIVNAKGGRLLPLGYGTDVNIPYITSYTNHSCVKPPFIQTRISGGADVDKAVYNSVTGLFSYGNVVSPGANARTNGDCSLPGETTILNVGCQSSVSVFTVDYDAPLDCKPAPDVRSLLLSFLQCANSTHLSGGLANSTTAGSTYTTSTGAPKPTSTVPLQASGAGYLESSWAAAAFAAFIVAAFALSFGNEFASL